MSESSQLLCPPQKLSTEEVPKLPPKYTGLVDWVPPALELKGFLKDKGSA